MKKVLIIGGFGFIGKHLLTQIEADRNITAFWLSRSLTQAKEQPENCQTRTLVSSLGDTAAITEFIATHNIDTVIHLASGLLPRSSSKQFREEITQLIEPTFRLIDALATQGIRFIFSSSGGTVYAANSGHDFRETSPLAPANYYGMAKLMIENYIRLKAQESGLAYVILRPANVYGSQQQANRQQGIIPIIVHHVLAGTAADIWADGTEIRDYIWAGDFIALLLKVVISDENSLTMNVGAGKGYSVNDICRAVELVSGTTLHRKHVANSTTGIARIVLDNSLAISKFGLTITPLDEGLKNLLREH